MYVPVFVVVPLLLLGTGSWLFWWIGRRWSDTSTRRLTINWSIFGKLISTSVHLERTNEALGCQEAARGQITANPQGQQIADPGASAVWQIESATQERRGSAHPRKRGRR